MGPHNGTNHPSNRIGISPQRNGIVNRLVKILCQRRPPLNLSLRFSFDIMILSVKGASPQSSHKPQDIFPGFSEQSLPVREGQVDSYPNG